MKHSKQAAALLAALTVSVALAACGGDGESSGGEGGEAVSGRFEPVAGVAAEYRGVAGEASLERADGKTTVSLDVTGLEPKTAYVAHLHTQGCEQSDPGGPHFQFEPGAGEEPPNEIHLEFSADAAGAGEASTTSKREVPPGEAGSVVLHEAGEDHAHTTAGAPSAGAALLVHSGHDHPEAESEGGGGKEAAAPPKIACAELEGSPGATAAAPTVVVRNGEPVGGVQELEFSAGERIRFSVDGGISLQLHSGGSGDMKFREIWVRDLTQR